MRNKIIKLTGVCAVVFSALLGVGAAFQAKDIARLKAQQEQTRVTQHLAITAGYMAAENGIPLQDFLKKLDVELNKLFEKQIREATNQ